MLEGIFDALTYEFTYVTETRKVLEAPRNQALPFVLLSLLTTREVTKIR